jgi:hypothetical protein
MDPVFELLKQNGGQNKMADHSKLDFFCPDFEWSTSLDHFRRKIVVKNIFFIIKRSRLAVKNVRSGFEMHSTTG